MIAAELVPNAGGLVAALAAIAGSLAWARRKWSSDSTAIVKDKTESRFVEQLLEREAIATEYSRRAAADRASDLAAIAELRATNRHQAEAIARLQAEFASFRRLVVRLYPDASRWLSSQAGAFEDTKS